MKFCDKVIQDHLLKGGEVKRKCDGREIHFGSFGLIYIDNNCKLSYILTKEDLKADDWVIADNYYDKIIANKILCFFWNENNDNYNVGYLFKVRGDMNYPFGAEILRNGYTVTNFFKNCKPLNANDYNIMNKGECYEIL